MRKTLTIITLPLICLLLSCAPRGSEEISGKKYKIETVEQLEELLVESAAEPENTELKVAIWSYYTRTGQTAELKQHAMQVFTAAKESNDDRMRAYAGSYLAQSYLNTDRHDSMKYYLDEVAGIVRRDDIHFLIAMNSNTAAIYAIKADIDFVEAFRNFKIAFDITRSSDDRANEGVVLCNMAYTYFHRGDVAGLQYTERARAIGEEIKNNYVLAYSALLETKLLLLKGDLDEALVAVGKLLDLAENGGQGRHLLSAYLHYGDIYAKQGQKELAEEYYAKALDNLGDSGGNRLIDTSVSYGNFLLDTGRPREAKQLFTSGLAASNETHSKESRHELLLGLSKAYQNLGQKARAEEYYQMYKTHSDSIFSIQKERAFHNQMMHYERIEHQQEIQDKEIGLVKATRYNHIYVFAIIFIAVVLSGIFMLYRRKNRMYSQLVEWHQEHLRREKYMKQIGARQAVAISGSVGNDENGEEAETEAEKVSPELYQRLEFLMDSDYTYRHKDVSLDFLAEKLDTNRAYISKAINQYAGMSFYDYIHSHRISEAVAILSDAGNDMPLKALSDQLGYNSLSVFYRCFQKETGVPPSKYRNEARKLNKH